MFCPNCNAQIPDDARVCPACAAALPQTPMAAPPRTNPMAIWSLVLGIIGLVTCGFTLVEIPGLILGIIGLKRINERPQEFGGKGIALAGIITSVLAILAIGISLILGAVLFPTFNKAKGRAEAMVCQNNVRQLGTAIQMYLADNDDRYPPADKWCDATKSRAPLSAYVDPAVLSKQCGYGFNSVFGSGSEADMMNPANTVMIFESDRGWNACGMREAMISKPRHGAAYVIGFGDHHVESLDANRIDSASWELTR